MATQEQVKQFFKTMGPIAAQVCKERGYGNAQIWTCLCQGACESAYGTSSLMRNANAFFGIKASDAWVKAAKYGGKVYNSKTSECYDGKTYTQITACFRAYNNMTDSVRDYFDLISNNRYKESLTKQTVKECITVIKNGGYATSPTYINTITTIFEKYKDLITCYTVNTIEQPKPQPVQQSTTYKTGLYKVLASGLNIRKGPGTTNPVVGCITDKGIYTIVEVKGNWGRLKSGAGWICIDKKYCNFIK